ncbi:6471_t:CDS:2 [Entrophospora sp. SA101]|nr:154_t:CDS:2 [Entrophospora sp. SA101]CAJ0745084.1 6471_t:CDS:2 [Entrophospora sp. SA101]CAJ0829910.1 13069_t:CDS:2 [Entrophospora sp. SA101]CAJ0905396.1 13363_t:CDS:2 [Entrophospora sp. SA101]
MVFSSFSISLRKAQDNCIRFTVREINSRKLCWHYPLSNYIITDQSIDSVLANYDCFPLQIVELLGVIKTAAIDWSKVTVSLGLKRETVLSLQAFRKRNEEAKRNLAALKEQKKDVDFEHYRKILKNQAIVNEAEKVFKSFKPTKVDLDKQINIIETFENKAVANAEKTVSRFDSEFQQLQKTLTDIEKARPFEDTTVDDIVKAKPEINDIVEKMIKKGQWTVPGYFEKFGYGF